MARNEAVSLGVKEAAEPSRSSPKNSTAVIPPFQDVRRVNNVTSSGGFGVIRYFCTLSTILLGDVTLPIVVLMGQSPSGSDGGI